MAFEKIKIAYLKKRLLWEEKKEPKRNEFRIRKEKLQKKLADEKELELELKRRISIEKMRSLTDTDKKRIQARKDLNAKRINEIKDGLKSIGTESKNFFVNIAKGIAKANQEKDNRINALQKKQSQQKKTVKKVSKKKSSKKKKKK